MAKAETKFTPEQLERLTKVAPDLYETLTWFLEFCDEHPEWTENELCNGMDDSAEACWLAGAREIVARVEQASDEELYA